MYLKTFLLSDIVIGSRVSIAAQFWDQLQPMESTLAWPRTNQPTPSAWNTWRQVLTSVLNLGRNQCLAIPLGKWQVQTHPQGWYYYPATNSLWEITGQAWLHHGCIPQCTRQMGFHSNRMATEAPPIQALEKQQSYDGETRSS